MKRSRFVVAGVAIVAALVLAGCSTGQSTGGGGGGGAAVDLAKYQKIVDQYTADVKWNGPKEAAPAPEGLHVGVLVCTVELEGCRLPMQGIQAAVAKLGWTQKTVVTTDPGQYSAAMKSLLLDNPKILFLVGITQSIIADGIAQAKAAGVPVISIVGGNTPGGANAVDAEVQPDKDSMGEAIAAKMIVDLKGKPNAIVLHDGEFDYEVSAGPALEKCSSCIIAKKIDFTTSELQTSFPTKVTTALQADPSINAIYLPFDPPASFLVPALVTAGYSKIPVYSQLGTSSGLEFVRQGQSLAADIAIPEEWAGWAGVDQGIRVYNKQSTADENIPAKILTKSNLPPKGEPFSGDGVDYQGDYLKLWKK